MMHVQVSIALLLATALTHAGSTVQEPDPAASPAIPETPTQVPEGPQLPPPDAPAELGAPFVPRVPRTETDRERLDSIRAYMAGRALEDRRQLAEAIEYYEEARRKDPNSPTIIRSLARLYFGLGQIRQAVEASQQAIEADPRDDETIRRLVRYYRQTGNTESAENLLTTILKNPGLPNGSAAELVVLHDLAQLYMDARDFTKAVEPLERLVKTLDKTDYKQLSAGELERVLGPDPPGAYRKFGEALYNARRFDLAVAAFERSLAYEPENPQTPLFLAQSLLRGGKAESALAILKPILDRRPPGRIAYDIYVQILGSLGRNDEIRPLLEDAVKADPQNFLLRFALGEQYEKAGDVERARSIYRQVVSEQPDPQGIRALSDSLRNEGKFGEMIQLFETAITQPVGRIAVEPQIRLIATDPAQTTAILDAGIELLKAEPPKLGPAGRLILVEIANQADRTDKLVEIDRINLNRNPSPTSYSELATTQASAGLYVEAVQTLNNMIVKFPQLADDSRVLGNLGLNQFQAGQVEESLTTGRKILEKDPDDFVAIELIGFALNRLGRHQEAIELYRDVLRRFDDNDEAQRLARIWLSNVYSTLGEYEKGEAELKILLERDPEDAWVNNDLGYLWADQGKNLEQAEQMIRKAVTQEPENGSYLDSLGWVLFKRGKIEEATHFLEEALRIKKSDATVFDHLGDAYYRLGKIAQARESWRKARELAEESDPPDPVLPKVQEKLEALEAQGSAGSGQSDINP